MRTKQYDTDLTDDQWERVEPFFAASKSGTARGGRPAADRRAILDAIFYLLRAGCSWRLLPGDFPPWQTVYHYARLWRLDGTWERVHARVREEVRLGAGAPPEPAVGRLDSQTVKTGRNAHDRGYDGGKKNPRPQAVRAG